jgi:ClpP class serine protease
MPTLDPEKNKQYVAKHRAMKKANEETKKEYNQLNASYYAKHATKLKEQLGTEEYNKEKAEYMRQYRAKQKEAKQLIDNNLKNSKAIMLQNAIRNKLARNALLQQKQNTNATSIQSAIRNKLARNALLRQIQNRANEVISQINQERQAQPIKRRGRPRKQV